YAGSGAFTRTGANYDGGARTPLAAVFSALIVCAVLLFAPGLTAFLPMPAMAGIVLLVAWRLIDFHDVRRVVSVSRSESAVLLITFFATLLLALEYAIYVGVLLSLALYLRRTAHPRLTAVAPWAIAPVDPCAMRPNEGCRSALSSRYCALTGRCFSAPWTMSRGNCTS